ncbi:MAG: peptide chain release factor N(5)-glutamine methyltransferase [Gemmataceae bacterium]|jgi:release factor glutamine methyltransferase|nr:peptide chain release factor N(5)-glutamine methyltransferase [Gemmataceae bacterium]
MTATPESWTVARLLEWTTGRFKERGIDSPRLEAEILLACALGIRRIDLYVRHDQIVDDAGRARFRDMVRRRQEGCPTAHIVGKKEFYSLDFAVSPATLIPRPDTELLVDEALRQAKPLTEPLIADIGTGTGCVAVALAHRLPKARIVAVDISPEALETARGNATRLGVADRVDFRLGDLLAPLAGLRPDLIVSNPPYIPTNDIAGLDPGVRDHEPALALDGGPDGLRVIERLAEQALSLLAPGGRLLVEIGAGQEEGARGVLTRAGFTVESVRKDGGGHPRVVRAGRPSAPAQ